MDPFDTDDYAGAYGASLEPQQPPGGFVNGPPNVRSPAPQPEPDPRALLPQVQLSPAELRRAQQLRKGLARTQEQVDSGELYPQEGAALAGMINTALAPLNNRQQRAQQLSRQAMFRNLEEQSNFETVTASNHHNFMASAVPQRIVNVPHPATGQPMMLTTNHQGTVQEIGAPTGPASPAAQQTNNMDLVHQLYQMADHQIPQLPPNATQAMVAARNQALQGWVNGRMQMMQSHMAPGSMGGGAPRPGPFAQLLSQGLLRPGGHGTWVPGGGPPMGGGGPPGHLGWHTTWQAPPSGPGPAQGMPPIPGSGQVTGVFVPGQQPQGFGGQAAPAAPPQSQPAYSWVPSGPAMQQQPGQAGQSGQSSAGGQQQGGLMGHPALQGMNPQQRITLLNNLIGQARQTLFPAPQGQGTHGITGQLSQEQQQQQMGWVIDRLNEIHHVSSGGQHPLNWRPPSSSSGGGSGSSGSSSAGVTQSSLSTLTNAINQQFPASAGGANATLNTQLNTHAQILQELFQQHHGIPQSGQARAQWLHSYAQIRQYLNVPPSSQPGGQQAPAQAAPAAPGGGAAAEALGAQQDEPFLGGLGGA